MTEVCRSHASRPVLMKYLVGIPYFSGYADLPEVTQGVLYNTPCVAMA